MWANDLALLSAGEYRIRYDGPYSSTFIHGYVDRFRGGFIFRNRTDADEYVSVQFGEL